MSVKNINFDDEKSKRSTCYKKKAINDIEDIDVNNILVSRKDHMVIKTNLNTLLVIMIMISLDHYV